MDFIKVKNKVIIILILMITVLIFNANNDKNLVKRRAAVLNTINISKNAKYDHICMLFRETIKSNLMNNFNFQLTDFYTIDELIKQSKNTDFTSQVQLKELSLDLGADIIIYTDFTVQNEEVIFNYSIYDLLNDDIVMNDSLKTKLGIELFDSADKITRSMTNKINNKFKKIGKSFYEKTISDKYGSDKLITFDSALKDNLRQSIKMIYVESGYFLRKNIIPELPPVKINMNGFYIGNFELTQLEWKAVTGDNPSRNKGDYLPVDNISWYQAVEFCNLKSIKEGLEPCYTIDKNNIDPGSLNFGDTLRWAVKCDFNKNGYRLPTEAEWEYAARGGVRTMGYIFSGTNDLFAAGWFYENSDNISHIAGQKIPNELKLYDMSGNVYEWCWDWHDAEYFNKSNNDNPKGPASGKYRTMRGGCMNNKEKECRVYDRTRKDPDENLSKYGIRLVRTRM